MKKINGVGAAITALVLATGAFAQAPGSYVAGIWTDPDGCQHWVMDLGIEGMMSPVLKTNGKPVCSNVCATLPSEALFATDSAVVPAAGRDAIVSAANSLKSAGRTSVSVLGHTDSVGSSAYNIGLSQRRAAAVAAVLQTSGLSVTGSAGAGESKPRATNSTAAGRQANRRVEIICK